MNILEKGAIYNSKINLNELITVAEDLYYQVLSLVESSNSFESQLATYMKFDLSSGLAYLTSLKESLQIIEDDYEYIEDILKTIYAETISLNDSENSLRFIRSLTREEINQ